MSLPPEIRLQIYDACIDTTELKSLFDPKAPAVDVVKARSNVTVEVLAVTCWQIRTEICQHSTRLDTSLRIVGFPQYGTFVSDKLLSRLPMCARVFQRLCHLELHIQRADAVHRYDALSGYVSVVRSIFVLEELAALLAVRCRLRVLDIALSDTESESYHHFEAQMLGIIRSLARIRGLENARLAGPGPFGGSLASSVVALMKPGWTEDAHFAIVEYERSYKRYTDT